MFGGAYSLKKILSKQSRYNKLTRDQLLEKIDNLIKYKNEDYKVDSGLKRKADKGYVAYVYRNLKKHVKTKNNTLNEEKKGQMTSNMPFVRPVIQSMASVTQTPVDYPQNEPEEDPRITEMKRKIDEENLYNDKKKEFYEIFKLNYIRSGDIIKQSIVDVYNNQPEVTKINKKYFDKENIKNRVFFAADFVAKNKLNINDILSKFNEYNAMPSSINYPEEKKREYKTSSRTINEQSENDDNGEINEDELYNIYKSNFDQLSKYIKEAVIFENNKKSNKLPNTYFDRANMSSLKFISYFVAEKKLSVNNIMNKVNELNKDVPIEIKVPEKKEKEIKVPEKKEKKERKIKPKKEPKPKKEKKERKIRPSRKQNKVVEEIKVPETKETKKETKEQIIQYVPETKVQENNIYLTDEKSYSEFINNFGKIIDRSKRFEKVIKNAHAEGIADYINRNKKNNMTDLYPTPQNCLKKLINGYAIGNNILEPTAGIGSVLYYLLTNYKDRVKNITAVEFMPTYADFLKYHYKNVDIREGDFLTMNFIGHKYDTIICNPPFSLRGYKNDKNTKDNRFYYNFLFRCLELLAIADNTDTSIHLIFICPPLFEKDNLTDFNYKNLLHLSEPKKKEILKNSMFKVNDFDLYFNILFSQVYPSYGNLGDCKFETTGVKVNFYVFTKFRSYDMKYIKEKFTPEYIINSYTPYDENDDNEVQVVEEKKVKKPKKEKPKKDGEDILKQLEENDIEEIAKKYKKTEKKKKTKKEETKEDDINMVQLYKKNPYDTLKNVFDNTFVTKNNINNLLKIIKKLGKKYNLNDVDTIYQTLRSKIKNMSQSQFSEDRINSILIPLYKYIIENEIPIIDIVNDYGKNYNYKIFVNINKEYEKNYKSKVNINEEKTVNEMKDIEDEIDKYRKKERKTYKKRQKKYTKAQERIKEYEKKRDLYEKIKVPETKEREIKVQEKPSIQEWNNMTDKQQELLNIERNKTDKKKREEYKENMKKLNKQVLVPYKPKEGERTILDITDDIVKHYQTKKGSKSGLNIADLKKELISRLNENKILLLKDIIRDTNYVKGNKYYDVFSKNGKNFHVNTLLPRYEQQEASKGSENEKRSNNENVPNWKVLEILYNNFSLKNRRDVINTTNLLAQIPNGRYISEIITSENVGDLYPTPQECLTRFITNRDLDGKTILEPSAGMGSIIYNVLMRNLDDVKINAVEYDVNMSKFLKHQFPNVGITNADFLTTGTINNNYDLIICNPPFSHYYQNSKGKSTYDKSYFINFYFKCCDYLRNSQNPERHKILYFICPLNFFKEFWGKKYYSQLDKDGGYTSTQYFSPELDQIRNMTDERIKQIKEQSDLYNKYENFEEYYDNIQPDEAALLPYKCMFQTTGTKVYFYRFMFL